MWPAGQYPFTFLSSSLPLNPWGALLLDLRLTPPPPKKKFITTQSYGLCTLQELVFWQCTMLSNGAKHDTVVCCWATAGSTKQQDVHIADAGVLQIPGKVCHGQRGGGQGTDRGDDDDSRQPLALNQDENTQMGLWHSLDEPSKLNGYTTGRRVFGR